MYLLKSTFFSFNNRDFCPLMRIGDLYCSFNFWVFQLVSHFLPHSGSLIRHNACIRYADWALRSSVRTTSRILASIIRNSFALFLRTASQRLLEWLSWLRECLLRFLLSRGRVISRNLRSMVQASLDRLSGPKCPSLPHATAVLPPKERPTK